MDAGQKQPEQPGNDLWKLPDVLNAQVVHAHYTQPQTFVAGPKLIEAQEGIEITITVSSNFPIRALSPVLYVGDHALTEFERVGENQYRFYAHEASKLKQDAPLSLGWFGLPQRKTPTSFAYRVHREETR